MLEYRPVLYRAADALDPNGGAREIADSLYAELYGVRGSTGDARSLFRYFEGRSSLKTWIYRIAVNQCHNRRRFWHRRRRDRETPLDERLLAGPLPSGGPSVAASPYDEALRIERARLVQAALLELCFEHRSVLVLREVEGLSCEEVAVALGVPEGTVKSRLSRAREAMRRKLAGLFDGGNPR